MDDNPHDQVHQSVKKISKKIHPPNGVAQEAPHQLAPPIRASAAIGVLVPQRHSPATPVRHTGEAGPATPQRGWPFDTHLQILMVKHGKTPNPRLSLNQEPLGGF